MKILVTSDMHGKVSYFEKAINNHPDIKNIFFLGDGLSKAEEISYCYDNKTFYMVPGNCDNPFSFLSTTGYEFIEGVKILYTHGHAYNVKSSLSYLKEKAKESQSKLCLYGHTHNADILYENGIYFVNPGTLAGKNGLYSYAVIDITKEGIVPRIMEI
ncbi:MAG: YfcE family phosphodiesterase [Clostridia bacterium]|nr:YfcE family phosphodiesterase [Clostridia bacterium]